jgi:uncharacterized protein (UPF0332 family)
MPRTLPEGILEYFARRSKPELGVVHESAHKDAAAQAYLREMVSVIVADRLALAREHLASARRALQRPPQPRMAISRAYYAMYHCLRATVFFEEHGDFDGHTDLPAHLPRTFPNRGLWYRALRDARFNRNEVDYSPYPRDTTSLQPTARQMVADADGFIGECDTYLRSKGWTK